MVKSDGLGAPPLTGERQLSFKLTDLQQIKGDNYVFKQHLHQALAFGAGRRAGADECGG